MRRRTFLIAACASVITIPIINYSWSYISERDPLSYPNGLGRFCDENTIREIGIKYRKLFPHENVKEALIGLLMQGFSNNSDKSLLKDFMTKKIYEDFVEYKIIAINGWIISITEARQCALFSTL
jgi:hypothetical protein